MAYALNKFRLTTLIPYITIIIGLHFFKSAWSTILLYHAAVLLIILATDNSILLKKLIRGWNWKIGLPLAIISALSGISLYFLWPVFGIEGLSLSSVLRDYGLHGSSWSFFMIYYCIATPIIEEAFWRGFLSATGRFPSGPDILFAGYHIIVLILFLKPLPIISVYISLVIVAWLWRLISLKLNGLAIPFVSHLVAGVSVIWFVNQILTGRK